MDAFVVFIAYASADGFEFAGKLVKWLDEFDPPVTAWRDYGNPQDTSFEQRVENAILGSHLMLLVLTPAAAAHGSWARLELHLAKRWNTPVIAVRPPGSDAELPFTVSDVTTIDLPPAEDDWQRLAHHLRLLRPTDETIVRLTALLRETERQASDASGPERVLLQGRAGVMSAVIQQEQRRRSDPALAERRVDELIRDGQRRDATGRIEADPDDRFRVVDGPPAILGGRYHDRYDQRERLIGHLGDPAVRILTLCGPPGAGKTTLVSDLITHLPQLGYVGVTYVSTHSPSRVTPDLLLEKLARAHPDPYASALLLERLADRSCDWRQKLAAAVERFGERPVLIVVDNAEEVLHEGRFPDPHLREFVHTIAHGRGHQLRLLLVSHTAGPQDEDDPGRTPQVDIPPNLPRPFVDDFTRGLDGGNAIGLENVSEEAMRKILRLTAGHPRKVELLYAALRCQQRPDLDEFLDSAAGASASAENCARYFMQRIVGDSGGPVRRVVQALAVYGRPVRSAAVSWLLAPYDPGFDSTAALALLCDQRIARRDGDLYHLPAAPENAVVLETIPLGRPGDRASGKPKFSRYALWSRGAEYFHGVSRLEMGLHDVRDLSPYLDEIDLRLTGGEYPRALRLVDEIDHGPLRRWGYRSLVLRPRERLVGRLAVDGAAEVGNRYELAAIYLEASRPAEAETTVVAALELSHAMPPEEENALRLQLAEAYYGMGRLSAAVDEYRETLRRCQPEALATGRMGLAICLTELGRVEEALDQYSAALEVADSSDEAFVRLAQGLVYQDLGRFDDALASIDHARRLAGEHSDARLAASCDDAAAYVLIDTGRLGHAHRLAESAIRAATDTGDVELAREAYATLALVRLLVGDVREAHDAADAAARFLDNQRPAAPLVLLAITQLRRGDRRAAELSFRRVLQETDRLLTVEPRAVQVLDIRGLALAGLARCDRFAGWEPARAAYQRARDRTQAPGVVLRAVRLLQELLDGEPSPGARDVLDAARGVGRQ